MSDVKALIADDEPNLRRYLGRQLREVWPGLEVVGEAGNGPEAVESIERLRPHVAFLDIRMPGLTGLQVAERIAGYACRVVFVTAYDSHAVEAFEKEAVDYLLKPVTAERLELAVRRLKQRLNSPVELDVLRRILSELAPERAPGFLQYLRVQQGGEIRLVPVSDVQFFKAQDKYTSVITRDGEALIRKSIKELSDELDPEQFWQIHRGTIVRVSAIARVGRSLTGKGVLRLKDGGASLTVSSRFMHRFKQM
jgi:DNA-binding LytR/AlgR family response regulator